MGKSKLEPKGTCYECNQPVPRHRIFCGKPCQAKYTRRNENTSKRREAEAARIEAIGKRNDERMIDHCTDSVWYIHQIHNNGIHARRMG